MQFCSLFFFITPKSCKCYCKKKYSDVEWVHKDMLVLLVRSICSNNCSEVLAGTRVTGGVFCDRRPRRPCGTWSKQRSNQVLNGYYTV